MTGKGCFDRIVAEAMERPVNLTLVPSRGSVSVFLEDAIATTLDGKEAEAFAARLAEVTGVDIRMARAKPYEVKSRSVELGDGRYLIIQGVAGTVAEGGATKLTIRRGTGRVAMIAARLQPPQKGHVELIRRMIDENDAVIVVLGSSQRRREMRHPFSWEQRKRMLGMLFGDQIRIVAVQDIDSLDSTDDWINYVVSRLADSNLPEPTDYYAGSIADAKWYVNFFADYKTDTKVRADEKIDTWESARTGRRLHIFKRELNGLTATDVRSLIERRDDDWKPMAPEILHGYIEWNYPPELRIAIPCEGAFPENVPVGTAAIRTDYDPPTRFRLVARGQWQPERPSNTALHGVLDTKEI